MKNIILSITFIFPLLLEGQSTVFQHISAQTQTDIGEFALETPDSNYLVVINQWRWNIGSTNYSFISKLDKKGVSVKKLIFKNDSIICYIKSLVPTNYGFLGVGGQATSGRAYLWLIKIDKQLNVINEKLHAVPNTLQTLVTDTDRDSNIIIGGSVSYKTSIIPRLFGARVNKNGDLNYLKYQYPDPTQYSLDPYNGFFDYMIAMKDSSRYVFFNGYIINSLDSNFNIVNRISMPYMSDFSYSLNPTAMRLTDTTYYVAGKGFDNITDKRSLYFSVVTLGSRFSNFKMLGVEDTFEQVAVNRCLDTTKNGDIYIGSTFNFPMSCQNPPLCNDSAYFVLQKMDKQTNQLWKKRYGKDGQYVMFGLLAARDGGCLMYGYRYTHDTPKQFEGYILKVDGNGVMTSETFVPMLQSSITAYPNPSNGQLNFKKEEFSRLFRDPSVSNRFGVNIFDISGKLVFQKRETDLTETFDLSHLSEGNYMYQITSENAIVAVGKWVKIKN